MDLLNVLEPLFYTLAVGYIGSMRMIDEGVGLKEKPEDTLATQKDYIEMRAEAMGVWAN